MNGKYGKTYYEVLQIDRKASPAVIQGAYRALLKNARNHPDLGGSEEHAKLINEAFATLADPVARREYDRELELMHPALGFRPPVVRTQYILICPSCRKRNVAEDAHTLEQSRCGACGKPLLPRTRMPQETDHARVFKLGLYLFDRGMLDRSRREFHTAVRLQPRQPQYHYWLGRCFYQTRNYQKSRQSFQAAVTLNPKRFHFQFWLGQSNYALKNYNDAAQSFGVARRARPRHTPTLLRLASCYFHLGEFEKAIEVLESAIAEEPGRLQLYTLLGVIYLAGKNKAEALKAFRKAERLSPKDSTTRRYIDLLQAG